MCLSPVRRTLKSSAPHATFCRPCFHFGVRIGTLSEATEIDCESLTHESLTEIGHAVYAAIRDNAGKPVARARHTGHMVVRD